MPIMQIDERKTQYARVEIVWDSDSDKTWVHVECQEYGVYNIDTTKSLAHEVFEHALAYRNPQPIAA